MKLASRHLRIGIPAFLAAAFFLLSRPSAAFAANLSFSPAGGTYAVGTTLNVGVYVESADQAMNAASSVIGFPADKLEVVSVSKSGTVFDLWVREPSFSNSAGTVAFEGIKLTPGFQGARAKLIGVTFKVKAAGIAALSLGSASVLANDGQGTQILTGRGGASFTLTDGGSGGMPAPRIVSSTHPDQNAWYVAHEASFSWNVPSGVDAVRLLISQVPSAEPTVVYTPPISSKTVKDLTDGTWYFHVQFRKAGAWGPTAHYRLQIDSEDPERLDIRQLPSGNLSASVARFSFEASDRLSGIVRYEAWVDGAQAAEIPGGDTVTYETQTLAGGPHLLEVRAYDAANRWRAASTSFTIEIPSDSSSLGAGPVSPDVLPKVENPPPTKEKRSVLWPIAVVVATTPPIFAAFLLGFAVASRKKRREFEAALREGREEVAGAFEDLREGTPLENVERRTTRALDAIIRRFRRR